MRNYSPFILNFQLNRFIFDMKTGRKKKLNSFVQFPEELDMSTYVGAPPGSHVYSLKGVLMHVGADANHGHYIAHIQVRTSYRTYTRIMISKGLVSKGQYSKFGPVKGFQYSF